MIPIRQWLADNADLPRLEAELLLEACAGLSRAQIIAYPERLLTTPQCEALGKQAAALREGTPIAYILGEREFWGLSFTVTSDVLIPRPETELLVELVIAHAPHTAEILDLGTGSGAIAVAAAHERPDLQVTAVDRSCAALGVARENAQRQQVAITFKHSNWFTELQGQWDVIVSNPPYIAPNDPHLPALAAEPAQALIAAEDGLADLSHIIGASGDYLRPQGWLMVEHGYNQAHLVRNMMQQAGFKQVTSARDLAQIERATYGRWL
jgi:release factor glutamine methyltransferase